MTQNDPFDEIGDRNFFISHQIGIILSETYIFDPCADFEVEKTIPHRANFRDIPFQSQQPMFFRVSSL